jgi:hypothetical protein
MVIAAAKAAHTADADYFLWDICQYKIQTVSFSVGGEINKLL